MPMQFDNRAGPDPNALRDNIARSLGISRRTAGQRYRTWCRERRAMYQGRLPSYATWAERWDMTVEELRSLVAAYDRAATP